MSDIGPGGRFVPRRPFKLGRDAPRKLAARNISESEVRALMEDHVVVDVVEEHGWTTEKIERMLDRGTEEGAP